MRKSSVVRLSAAVLACGALFTAYTQFGNQPSKLNTIKLKDDLYVIHNDFVPGNTTALITNDGVLLVDDKFEIDHAGIMAELKKITNKPVKYVINTHHHGDHSGGNVKLQAMDAKVVASQEAREQMVVANQPGLPDIVIEHHAHIYLGGKNVALYHFGRSHTNGDMVVLFPADRRFGCWGHVHQGRRRSRTNRLFWGRQRGGMAQHAALGAATGFRHGSSWPRADGYQTGYGRLPREHHEAGGSGA